MKKVQEISQWNINSELKVRKKKNDKKFLSILGKSKPYSSNKIVSRKWRQIQPDLLREKQNLVNAYSIIFLWIIY